MTISRADASGTSTGHSLANAATNGVLTAQFVALLAVNAAFSFSFSTYFLLPKFMAQQLGAGASQIGALATVFGATTLLTIPLVGRLLDGSRNRSVIIAACALMAVSALGFVWIDEVGPLLYVLRCLQGLALSMFNAAAAVMVTEMAPPGRLAQSLGLFAGSGMAMTAVAPAFVEWLTERTSYRPAFALASASAVLALGLALRLTVGQHAHAAPSSLRTILRRPSSLRMILVLGSAGLGFGVMFAFSSPYALGLGMKNVRGFFFAFAAAAVCVRLLLGRAIDTIGPARVATASLIGYGLVVASMCALTPGRLEVLGGLFGLTHGLFIPAFNAFILGDAAQHERGKLVTLFHGAFNLGNCAVVLLGLLAERVGYPIVFALTGALMLSSPLLMLGWPRSTS